MKWEEAKDELKEFCGKKDGDLEKGSWSERERIGLQGEMLACKVDDVKLSISGGQYGESLTRVSLTSEEDIKFEDFGKRIEEGTIKESRGRLLVYGKGSTEPDVFE